MLFGPCSRKTANIKSQSMHRLPKLYRQSRAWCSRTVAPGWIEHVAPLRKSLVLPTSDGEVLRSKEDPRADGAFLAKSILLWTPPSLSLDTK